MIHDWNWVSDYLSITLEIIAQFSRLNLWAFRTTRCGSFSTVNSMAKRRSQISMSIIAVKVLIKYDFGRCRRLLRPPTRLWNCPWCRTASTALCYLHTCPWFRTELLHGIKLVRSPSSKNSGTKLRGRTHKMFGISVGISLNNWGTQDWNFRWEFANSVSGKYNKTVLQWLASNVTLRKEFEKHSLGNIRLRAVPVRSWVASHDCVWYDFHKFLFCISIRKENISIVENFFLNQYFLIKTGEKKVPSLKTPNLQGFLLTPNNFGDR